MNRANYLPAPHFFNLNHACAIINQAFGQCYLVGSSITRRDYRDVDVRCILTDEEYDRLFDGLRNNPRVNAKWSIICSSVSLWLSQQSGLPIDFQIQMMTEANAGNDGPREALGIFFNPPLFNPLDREPAPPQPPATAAPSGERIYPCDRCGKLRSKDEGGTTFTVCDECWDVLHPKPAPEPTPSGEEADGCSYCGSEVCGGACQNS